MNRKDGRKPKQIREITLIPRFIKTQASSILIEMGNTRVLCTGTVDFKQPKWMGHDQKSGWVTAEYNMLPNSSLKRIKRERYGISGRTKEIQRIISRSVRAAVDLNQIGPITIVLDCDVLEADGGTRTASITGAYVCLVFILNKLKEVNNWSSLPLKGNLAAISIGKVDGEILVDLNYEEDSQAEVDCNIAALSGGKIIETQATGEGGIFTKDDLNKMVDIALNVMNILYKKQNDCLKEMGVEL